MSGVERMRKTLHCLHAELPVRIDVMDREGTVLASTQEERRGTVVPDGGDTVRLPLPGSSLVVGVDGSGPWAESVAHLAAMLLTGQAKASPREERRHWLRTLLCGEVTETAETAIRTYLPARVILIRIDDAKADAVSRMVKKAFPEPNQCLSCVMDASTVALIVSEAGQDREDYVQLAQAILDTMENELDVDGAVGISSPAKEAGDIPGAYGQAECASRTGASIGRHPIRVYDDMILERMVYALSEDVRRSLVTRLLDEEGKYLLDQEMMHTAQVFLDSGLNLSETARRLYVHRNTLIYRLDKIQKILDLDLRDFHGAMVFRVLVMASHRGQEDDAT